MAITKLPVNFKDDIIDTTVNTKRRYRMEENSDGTTSLEDVTTYEQTGSYFGAEQINATNGTVNELIDATSNVNNTADSEKRVLYAESAGKANEATTAINATNAENATKAQTSKSADNDFILVNNSALGFSGNVCVISDERITENSLADVYFTSDTIENAEDFGISVETFSGRLTLTAVRTVTETIRASIKIRVV